MGNQSASSMANRFVLGPSPGTQEALSTLMGPACLPIFGFWRWPAVLLFKLNQFSGPSNIRCRSVSRNLQLLPNMLRLSSQLVN